MYYVYVHTVPNGKYYVGMAKSLQSRWANGEGYKNNKEFYEAINTFGWNNIKHEVIGEYDCRETALVFEALITFYLNSEDRRFGYNLTDNKKRALDAFVSRYPYNFVYLEKPDTNKNIFEASPYPTSVCKTLIEQWIFNKKHREILLDRLVDGMSYNEISEKYNLSVRQVKNIVSDGSRTLEEHL